MQYRVWTAWQSCERRSWPRKMHDRFVTHTESELDCYKQNAVNARYFLYTSVRYCVTGPIAGREYYAHTEKQAKIIEIWQILALHLFVKSVTLAPL